MKVKNLNRSSAKTKRIIKSVFAEMLSEYKEISRISVSELCRRADISRSTFYSHYDDTYSIAQDYENELIDRFSAIPSCLKPRAPRNLQKYFSSISAKVMKTTSCSAAQMTFSSRQKSWPL